ncbi:MAG: ribosome assembly cofactor RimP [Paludibacteraceae bacterium]|nr:ribosome assembly cofactor RimP [Paludibacteraceae bacterium]
MIDKTLVYQAIEEKLIGTEYFIVDVKVAPDNNILVEVDNSNGVDIDFCVELTKHIEAQFDREVEDYALEVGSAGLTQPFKVLKQYQKNIGNEVEVLTKQGKKITGALIKAEEHQFTVEIEKKIKEEGAKRKTIVTEEIPFLYEEVKYTKYIIRFK